ncbi:hypothetical protein KPATCC21470_0320 [Kitasatospora purpeofusca]
MAVHPSHRNRRPHRPPRRISPIFGDDHYVGPTEKCQFTGLIVMNLWMNNARSKGRPTMNRWYRRS